MSELAERQNLPEARTHKADFHGWVADQVALIQQRRFEAVDWQNVIEELMAAAKSEERALESHFEILLIHLLKWRYQRDQRDRHRPSWQASIMNAREKIERLIKRSPSLTPELDETFSEAYSYARRLAGAQIGWDREEWERELPDKCEWTLEQVRDQKFWPD
jgi:hypothetical protein